MPDGAGNPLNKRVDFLDCNCPKCGKKARRETDTMDTFVDSSWYFYRYCDSKNSTAPYDAKKIDYWFPIDQYIGGVEHAILHLIYSRFWTKMMRDVGLTTNAVLLAPLAADLWSAGLRRLNVHLDTLAPARFFQITRRDDFSRVMAGIDRAQEVGFEVKFNAVAVKNLCEPDVVPLARFGRERGIEIRYIEFMPLDNQGLWDKSKVLLQDQMMEMIRREIGELVVIPDQDPRAPATEYRFADGIGRIGFISSVSKPFCLNCNRLRLTSDGKMRYCLFAIEELDVKGVLRQGGSDAELAEVIRETVRRKWIGHEIHSQKFIAPPRPMYSIGG